MKKTNIFKKYRQLAAGILIGSVLSIGGVVFADTDSVVSVWVNKTIKIQFNGEKKELPKDYTVLTYNGRTYVPARFIAESLGAEVAWNEETRTISIDSSKEEQNKKQEEKPKEISKKEYHTLPMKKMVGDVWVKITNIQIDNDDEDDDATWIYLEVENKGDTPVQIDQGATKIEVNRKVHKQEDVKNVIYRYDQIWYNDIRKDDEKSGFIKMPLPEKDEKWENITLTLKLIQNDGSRKETEVSFDIAL